MKHPAIDIHSHMLCREWLDLFKAHSGPRFQIKPVLGKQEVIHADGVPFMTPTAPMFDYPARLKAMDDAGVAMAVLSLTGPNVYWGDAQASSQAARVMNDSFAQACRQHPDRFRWMASLPFQFGPEALEELSRCHALGAVGVMALANIGGEPWTAPAFAPIWAAIEKLELPVFMHPTVCCGMEQMGMADYQLSASVGFPFDSTMAVARMIYDGFFDRFPGLKLVVAHGGGTLPFLAGRLDRMWEVIPACREKIARRPSEYLKQIHADTALYTTKALLDTIDCFGPDNVLYGTDFPHGNADMGPSLERIDTLEPPLRDAVRGGNARRLFRF